MKFLKLKNQIKEGFRPIVCFTKGVEIKESYFAPQMVAKLVGITYFEDDNCAFICNVKPFDEINKQFELANYINDDGDACLTAREANAHPMYNSWEENLFFDYDDDTEKYFKFINDGRVRLFSEYIKERKDGEFYTEWLETKIFLKHYNIPPYMKKDTGRG